MVFAPDTELELRTVVHLINTAANQAELLGTEADLASFLDAERFTGIRSGTPEELASVHMLRGQLRVLWASSEEAAVEIINRLLRAGRALPQLRRHDGCDWHFHATTPDAPLRDRMSTEAAMAVADVVRGKEMGRMLTCAAEDCDAVLIDLSRNRSKRYCDTGNCANRAHVAAYRARQAGT